MNKIKKMNKKIKIKNIIRIVKFVSKIKHKIFLLYLSNTNKVLWNKKNGRNNLKFFNKNIINLNKIYQSVKKKY
jgi:hypothetical protein